MAKLPRSPIAQDVRNNYQPVQQARMSDADPVGRSLEQAGDAAFEIGRRMADSKIATEAAEASIRLRSRLDEEYRLIENDTVGDPAGLESRFRLRASEIVNEEAAQMRSPALKKAFGTKAAESVENFSISMRDVTRRRQVEGAKADTLKVASAYEALASDPSKPRELLEESRDDYIALVDRQYRLGIYSKDDAERLRLAADAAFRKGVSQRHLSTVDTLLDQGRAGEAEEYFKVNYGEIDPEARERAESVLEAKSLEATAITKADQFWADANGDYGTAITEAYKIQNPDERLAVESRLAQLKNQGDAAKAAADQALLEEGMGYIVDGRSLPSDLLRRASPMVIDRLQTEQRTRALWAQQMATATAQEKAAMREISMGNYRILKAQMVSDPEVARLGVEGILADPNLSRLWEGMSPDERGQFVLDAANARGSGGAPADAVSKAYKSVVNLASAYMPKNLSPKDYGKYFGGVGEGDPGVAYISANRSKPDPALVFEGELMRLVDEEMARTGGADIQADRAKQLVALAYAKAGEKKDGTTKYPIQQDIAAGVVETDMRRIALDYRQKNPAIWREATTLVRSQYPNASDATILEEARRIEQLLSFRRAIQNPDRFGREVE